MEATLPVSLEWSGLHIYKYQSAIEHCDHCQVGCTGVEGLVSALCRVLPENGHRDEQVVHKDHKKKENQIKLCDNQNYQLNCMSIWAKQM